MKIEVIEVIEGYETLNYKTEWQSLDGRCCVKWHGTLEEAKKHAKRLQYLGRIPQVWGRTEI